ncbi:hypothetical protein [Tumebacillus flagellatus]|uniref:Uncharacterized protein n=1 Tax=Tumebacillus flagellatus TaxID=1157490 RepID=A0A074LUE0_9BACL|nr:hypothetical protein [Tumebacillus flagellatus]KEO83548.1 hypothetical protein EL26_09030 [Tumebacillus flagellatus]
MNGIPMNHPVISATHWGPLLFTLIFGAAMAVILFAVIRRRALQADNSIVFGGVAKLVIYLAGLVLTIMFAFYLGISVLKNIGTPDQSMASAISSITVVEAGLIGALLPYRYHARSGQSQTWLWLVIGVVNALLFYVIAQILR